MRQRLSLLTIGVRDIARARRFYEEGLGWHRDFGQDDVAMYQSGGMVFALYEWPKLAEDAGVSPDGEGFRGVTLAYNARSKDEVRAVLEEARAAGAQIMIEPRDTFWGGYDAYFADPDGHLWEVAWNPYWTLSDDGSVSLQPPKERRRESSARPGEGAHRVVHPAVHRPRSHVALDRHAVPVELRRVQLPALARVEDAIPDLVERRRRPRRCTLTDRCDGGDDAPTAHLYAHVAALREPRGRRGELEGIRRRALGQPRRARAIDVAVQRLRRRSSRASGKPCRRDQAGERTSCEVSHDDPPNPGCCEAVTLMCARVRGCAGARVRDGPGKPQLPEAVVYRARDRTNQLTQWLK
jgi:catechol 2,3-dioxygenase-like lactoylglutathione lyase family enzyme